MIAVIEITPWHYAGFILCILFFLALDLGVFHRKAHVVRFKEALAWTTLWVSTSLLFAGLLVPLRGREEALEFLTGYIIELSLSMDNVFVIAVIFTYFRVPPQFQHRVLFWGILGALIMRGVMIALGVALIRQFGWILYVFGIFLVVTGIKMLFMDEEGVHPEKNPLLRLARRFFPVTPDFEGQKFVTRWQGRRALTPLALVLLVVETTDLMFAVDSIPAIFAVTQKPFIVFTSNVFAILGLRSLYFVLAGAIEYFRYLKVGLSVVLVFVGVKMLLDPHDAPQPRWWQVDIPTTVSLLVVAVILLTAILLSVQATRREKRAAAKPRPDQVRSAPSPPQPTSGQD
ncbi:MAG: TerC family protein [Verrucomicrobiales bacterium]|nr:TerC family protein [Verrucomicrobiales bacterium]